MFCFSKFFCNYFLIILLGFELKFDVGLLVGLIPLPNNPVVPVPTTLRSNGHFCIGKACLLAEVLALLGYDVTL